MNVADFDFDLPPHFIAQTPLKQRDSSRLMRLGRHSGAVSHHVFADIADMLTPNDVLVLNNTRVIPARLRARKAESGGAVELLLLRQINSRSWRALAGGRNIRRGTLLTLDPAGLTCLVAGELARGERIIEFERPLSSEDLAKLGKMPLPPYISAELADNERYQTVYSEIDGSAAAPTAGLHFTSALLERLQNNGVKLATCTLHIGLDTFQPVKAERVDEHKIHSEYARLDEDNAHAINDAKQSGGRIIAVGTTAARTLETAGIISSGGDPRDPLSGGAITRGARSLPSR